MALGDDDKAGMVIDEMGLVRCTLIIVGAIADAISTVTLFV